LVDASYANNRYPVVEEVARVPLPTNLGSFEARAFRCDTGHVYLALTVGEIADGLSVLTRVHSECLTGDALGSLRCDCGIQLRNALRAIRAEGRGVVVYATGHEGRGIGLVNKLRAYVEQDRGADTVDANLHIGMPVDLRDYSHAAAVLKELGVRSIRLITNNPEKSRGLEKSGLRVESVRPIPVAPHGKNVDYLRTKEQRLGHVTPVGDPLDDEVGIPPDVGELIGEVSVRDDRPYVVVKYAQTLDGRIATSTGDARWISGEKERVVSHALRARCDAIMVGVGTVLSDDPQLTVRLVPGASPIRVVLDSQLRSPITARAFDAAASTIVVTTEKHDVAMLDALRSQYVGVRTVPEHPGGVNLAAALKVLRREGIETLLVEGGAQVITSLLAAGLVDRLIVSLSPIVMGTGLEGVGDLGSKSVGDSVVLTDRTVHLAGDDVLISGYVARR
jgi:3,4-dihydroxy 2-butanone 4-phosphate synthase/GTP cyclohydrolase II